MPTALELGKKGWKPYVDAALKRHKKGQSTAQKVEDREELLRRIREAAFEIKKRFNAKRIFLFGSLAHGAWYGPASDVDLAVEGISGRDYWQAWQLVEEIVADRNVDFIDLEMAGHSLKATVARTGIEL